MQIYTKERFYTMQDGRVVVASDSGNTVLNLDGSRSTLGAGSTPHFYHDRRWTLNGLPIGYLYVTRNGQNTLLVDKPCFNIKTTDDRVFFKMYVEEDKTVYSYYINHDGTELQMLE